MQVRGWGDYREFLRATLETRAKRNPGYSLRAFARDLHVAPQVLSSVLRGKKGFSAVSAAQVAVRLGLSASECEYFCDLVALSQARTPLSRRIAEIRLARHEPVVRFQALSEDVFHAISDWYHYALLELTFVRGFRSDPAWIAKRLWISEHESKQAIARLIRLGLLKRVRGTLVKTEQNLATRHEIPSEGIRRFTGQILGKAIEAISSQALEERDYSTITMAIDPGRLPEAKEMIKSFRRKLMQFLESGDRTEVYCFAAELFRLSRPESESGGMR